jgi:hypothetical protein
MEPHLNYALGLFSNIVTGTLHPALLRAAWQVHGTSQTVVLAIITRLRGLASGAITITTITEVTIAENQS